MSQYLTFVDKVARNRLNPERPHPVQVGFDRLLSATLILRQRVRPYRRRVDQRVVKNPLAPLPPRSAASADKAVNRDAARATAAGMGP